MHSLHNKATHTNRQLIAFIKFFSFKFSLHRRLSFFLMFFFTLFKYLDYIYLLASKKFEKLSINRQWLLFPFSLFLYPIVYLSVSSINIETGTFVRQNSTRRITFLFLRENLTQHSPQTNRVMVKWYI